MAMLSGLAGVAELWWRKFHLDLTANGTGAAAVGFLRRVLSETAFPALERLGSGAAPACKPGRRPVTAPVGAQQPWFGRPGRSQCRWASVVAAFVHRPAHGPDVHRDRAPVARSLSCHGARREYRHPQPGAQPLDRCLGPLAPSGGPPRRSGTPSGRGVDKGDATRQVAPRHLRKGDPVHGNLQVRSKGFGLWVSKMSDATAPGVRSAGPLPWSGR